jgi:hypothetical protein
MRTFISNRSISSTLSISRRSSNEIDGRPGPAPSDRLLVATLASTSILSESSHVGAHTISPLPLGSRSQLRLISILNGKTWTLTSSPEILPSCFSSGALGLIVATSNCAGGSGAFSRFVRTGNHSYWHDGVLGNPAKRHLNSRHIGSSGHSCDLCVITIRTHPPAWQRYMRRTRRSHLGAELRSHRNGERQPAVCGSTVGASAARCHRNGDELRRGLLRHSDPSGFKYLLIASGAFSRT